MSALILIFILLVFVVISLGVPICQREQHLFEAAESLLFFVNHDHRHHQLAVRFFAQYILDLFQNIKDLVPQLSLAVFERSKLAGFLFTQVHDNRLRHFGVRLGWFVRHWAAADSCHMASRNWEIAYCGPLCGPTGLLYDQMKLVVQTSSAGNPSFWR